MTHEALSWMRRFHVRQQQLHREFNIDFVSNYGRRNVIMSAAQEEFFARALQEKLRDVVANGRTGKADIHIGELNRELECKLTTPLKETGAINFNTDYATLSAKGSLDYLYVISSANFQKFCVLHFSNLTTNDFRSPSMGSRGKAAMIKRKGMQKCNVLWGEVETQNDRAIVRLQAELIAKRLGLNHDVVDAQTRMAVIESALEKDVDFVTGAPLRSRRRCAMRKMRNRLRTKPARLGMKFDSDAIRIQEKIKAIRIRPAQYSFILKGLTKK
ncbi:MAG: hypothetical protein CMB80_28715 [Flammeovirgaceae bacterium]|nr:hypothetical protein [Flammeovirgaceae bacterium]